MSGIRTTRPPRGVTAIAGQTIPLPRGVTATARQTIPLPRGIAAAASGIPDNIAVTADLDPQWFSSLILATTSGLFTHCSLKNTSIKP